MRARADARHHGQARGHADDSRAVFAEPPTTPTATPTTIITFPLGAVPGVYLFEGSIQAYDLTDVAGGAYNYSSGIRTTGAAGIILGTEFKDVFEDAAMVSSDFNLNVSGNNLVVQVTGISGKTIDWNGYLEYRFVS